MASFAEYTRKKKKEKEGLSAAGKSFSEYTSEKLGIELDEIAPVKTYTPTKTDAPTKSEEKEKERTWFKSSKYFDDGYDFGDVTKTILGTVADVSEHLVTALPSMVESGTDALAMLGSAMSRANINQANFNMMSSPLAVTKKGNEYANGLVATNNAVQKETEKAASDFVKKDLIDEGKIAKAIVTAPFQKVTGINVEDASVSGERLDSTVQSAGQLAASIGLQALGVPITLTTGLTAFGSQSEKALNEGATYDQAALSATISAGAEVLSEYLSGGIKVKLPGQAASKTLDDALIKPFTEKISNGVLKKLVNIGVDATGEGFEEIFSSVVSNLGEKLYKEESIGELIGSEEARDEYLESFIAGMLLGGASSTVKTISDTKNSKNALNENEQKVFDKVVEDRITEATKDNNGKTISKNEETKIRKAVLNDMLKGYIDTDTIESVLGGEEYEKYKKVVDSSSAYETKLNEGIEKMQQRYDELQAEYDKLNELDLAKAKLGDYNQQNKIKEEMASLEEKIQEWNTELEEYKNDTKTSEMKTKLGEDVFNLVKDSRLSESYNERSRRGQTFEADLSKYDAKQQETVKKAIESGILNNTNRTHEFVDMVAKISADKGVIFDFVNNEKIKETGFAVEGKTVNGYKTDEGNIAVNIQSSKSLDSVVGHEITHVLEGTELYTELQNAVKEYATTKGEYVDRMQALRKMYEGVYEGEDFDSKIRAELTADIVGEYLFTDADFINKLSTEKPNVFKKLYDEIKYLYNVATAGSKEARQLEKVKRNFEKAYKEATKNTDKGTQNSLSEDSVGNKLTEKQSEYFKDSKMRDDNGNLKVMYHGSPNAGFHIFDANMSDDDTSFFFVDRNDVAASYSGTSETYEAKTIRTAEDMNNFLAEIGYDNYKAIEKNGKFELLENNEHVATKDTAQEIYEEFCWYEGVGEGDANYKVYLNLKNPLVVDAEGKNWNNISREFSQEIADRYNSLTTEEKEALTDVSEWGEYSIFRDELLSVAKAAREGKLDDTSRNLASAYEKLGGANANLYDAFSIASDNFSEEAINQFAMKQMKTRDYAQRAKEQGYDGVIFKNIVDNGGYSNGSEGASTVAIAFESNQIKSVANENPTADADIRYSLTEEEAHEANEKLGNVGLKYDAKNGTVSYSMSSLEDAFDYKTDKNGMLVNEGDYLKARNEYVDALAKSIAAEKDKPTREEYKKADRYLDSLFLIHDMIAKDRNRLDYEAAVNRSAWVGNVEYGGSIDFSTLCAKRRLFTGTFDAIQNALPDTVLTDKDFLNIRKLLLDHGEESPCSMCYVEGSRAKHGVYVNKWLKEYLKTNPEWKPQIADFTSTTRLEQTRIQHPEAYQEYAKAMNKLSQRKPKEASVRTDYKGEILDAFKNGESVEQKNLNGGIRFNSFSDFEIIHALDCMQVLTDMARVGLNGQAYTKVKDFAEAFGNTGLKINLSLVAKDVDANGNLVMDEINGMNYAEAKDIRERYSDNVGTVIVVFNDAQLKAALSDSTIDFVLPFHRSQWRKAQYTLMGLPDVTRDYTNIQNDRYKNPKTGRPKKAPNGNIMPNEYWDFNLSGRENAQRYLDYINENSYIPKFDFLLNKVDGKWVLPNDAVGDGYFKLLIDFKMYNNEGIGSPQKPVLPEFNMSYIQQMLNDYVGGHQAFPVAHDVVNDFVEGKRNGNYSLSEEGEAPSKYGRFYGKDIMYQPTDIAPTKTEQVAPTPEKSPVVGTVNEEDYAPMTEAEAEAMYSDEGYINSFTDADMPPEAAAPIYSADTTSIDDKALNNIAKTVKDALSLTNAETKAVKDIIQKYSTSENQSEADLLEEIRENFGEKTWEERNEEVANIKQVLRGYKINVSPTIKRDIADYAQFRKKNFGKIRFSNDGIPVDAAYMELSDSYPALFPASITNATDQLLQMAEVANMEIKETQSAMLDDESIQEAVELIVDVVNTYKESELLKGAKAQGKEFLKNANKYEKEMPVIDNDFAPIAEKSSEVGAVNEKNTPLNDTTVKEYAPNKEAEIESITTVKERNAAKLESYKTELTNNYEMRKEALNSYELKIEQLEEEYDNKRDKNTSVANTLLQRIERTKRLRDNVDVQYEKRINDLRSKIDKMNSEEFKTAEQRATKQEEYKTQMEGLIGDTSTWKDKKLGISYATNTLRRNLRDVIRDENGKRDIAKADAIYDELQGKYNHNEAELNRESNRIKQQFAEMKITKAEDTYIQMLGELRHNPETTLEEDVVKDFYEKNKKHIDEAKVDKVIEESRKMYDDLIERVNKVLAEQGMKEIPYRKGYFPHFTEDKQGFFGKLFNWKTQNDEIPTSIAGLTEMFEPNRSWQSFNKQRKTDVTDYSFMKGLDSYVQGSLDWIYHIEDIQKRRAFENQIRYTHSEKGIQEKIDAIFSNEEYDADEMQEQIDLVYREARNPLNNFIQDFHTATNSLAGKKSTFDRDLEQRTNRKVYSVMTNLSNRVSGNMVAGSVSSALTNFIPITQSWVEVSPVNSLRAMGETIRSTIRDDGTVNKSDFLTNRLNKSENLYKTYWDKVGKGVSFLMDAIDSFTSQTVWRSKYIQNMSKGMSENEAIKNADIFAANVMADRSRGNQPTLFDSKSPVAKVFTAFQLEVNNQYGYFFKDAPQDIANKSKARLAAGYATAFFGAYAYNALYSSLTGRDAAFDPIGIIQDLLKDLGFGGDDDEEEEIAPVDVLMNLTNSILEEVPFIGGLLGGGRIPISSAMPYGGIMEAFEGTLQDISEGNVKSLTKEWLNPVYYLAMPMGGGQIRKTNQGIAMFSDEHPVAGSYTDSGSLRFPVEETPWNVAQAAVFGQYANKNARTYFDEGYAPLKENQIKEYAKADMPIADYWKYREGLKDLDKQSEKASYINGLDISKKQKDVLKSYLYDEEGYKEENPEKYAFLEREGIGYLGYKELDEDTQSAWSWAFKHQDEYEYYKENGVLPGDYSTYYIPMLDFEDEGDEAYSWAFDNPEKATVGKVFSNGVKEYRQYAKDLDEIRADKDSNGKTISGSAKEKKQAYIWSLDIDEGAKYILFKREYEADDTYNYEILDYLFNREDLTYDEVNTICEELGFKVNRETGYISWD